MYCVTDTGPHLLRFFEGQGRELKATEFAQVRRCLLLKGIYLEVVDPGEWTLFLPEGSFRQQDADQGLQVASESRLDS